MKALEPIRRLINDLSLAEKEALFSELDVNLAGARAGAAARFSPEEVAWLCPRGRSPQDVDASTNFRRVREIPVLSNMRDQCLKHVVQHVASGLYFACYYAIRLDDSDYGQPAEWRQVFRKTTVDYVDANGN